MKFLFNNSSREKRFKKVTFVFLFVSLACVLFLYSLKEELIKNYKNLESSVVRDRHGEVIAVKSNGKGNYASYIDSLPPQFARLLVRKEDRFFYFHFGINPWSTFRALMVYVKSGVAGASSTITQQLVKNLLGNEVNRTLGNKAREIAYALALELFLSKKTILNMYGNSVYMGNQLQGFHAAAESYFGKKLGELSDTESLSLLATISSPSVLNPWKTANKKAIPTLGKRLGIASDSGSLVVKKNFKTLSDSYFEFESLAECLKSCAVTLDNDLSEKLRTILRRNIADTSSYGGRNGAIIAIKLPENELLAVIGTPDMRNSLSGSAINMAINPRPIGSTIKPFIYLKGFEKGLRPYTLVDDREYKFGIATGFPLYPKNYDGVYRGGVSLQEALSNSLNVPTVKVLQYVTLEEFYTFLERTLGFKPLQPMDSYQYGIALGGLEMDLLTLAHYFTIFANDGKLKPLQLFSGEFLTPPMETDSDAKHAGDSEYVQLVNKILTNRIAGVEQFGLKGNLNLSQDNYAVKTGTSRDFHDTWTVGFTPDFLVAVWLGNVENEPMRQITSSSGAGKIWHDAMELLINSPYNNKTPFDFSKISPQEIGGEMLFGLRGDNVEATRNLLAEKSLILNPHDGDTFEFQPGMQIKLKASQNVRWYVNGEFVDEATEVPFGPTSPNVFVIKAAYSANSEEIRIKVLAK